MSKLEKERLLRVGSRSVCFLLIWGLASCSSEQGDDKSQVEDSQPAPATEAATPAAEPAAASPFDQLPAPVVSSAIPVSVSLPASVTSPEQARPWFDTFSWQSFIALNWPVTVNWPHDASKRGDPQAPNKPATFLTAPNGVTTVWGSYKEAYELFSQNGNMPSPWDSNDDPIALCSDLDTGSKKMVMVNKGGTVLDGLNEAFSFPLIDQNNNYAWTEVRYNQQNYDFVRGTKEDPASQLYIITNLANAQNASSTGAIDMPTSASPSTPGAMMLKATWRQMTDKDDLKRYYVVDAYLYNTATESCDKQQMGLVGFHIAQKVQDFPQWIWSSFEQVDNVQLGQGAPEGSTPSFNNGTNDPLTPDGFANRPQDKAPPLQPRHLREPVQVSRINPIPTTPDGWSTVDLNKTYQKLLKGSVWEHYELVITQWPTDGDQFLIQNRGGIYPQDSGQPFPVNGAVNAVMETYFQTPTTAAGAGGNSCMSCHYGAARSDFSWVLQLRANQPPAPTTSNSSGQ